MTASYAFTHEKSQGQTLDTVLVDLAPHPGGELTLFHVYVALSHSKGRSSIHILRDFSSNLFMQHPSEHLRKEDARLALFIAETKRMHATGDYDMI
ncbi:hypothetical protein C8J56DRAFT_775633 [Mycena floridula]|nr:hypothetical protein C8J56DRAFT_775633 [Mycena floridula]